MADSPGPRDTKILGDILALVLDDQPAASAAALEALRRRARNDQVSGGALKNAFQHIVGAPPPLPPTSQASIPPGRDAVERLRAANDLLERALAAANAENAVLREHQEHLLARVAQLQGSYATLEETGLRRRGWNLIGALAIGGLALLLGVLLLLNVLEREGRHAPSEAQHAPPPVRLGEPAPRPSPVRAAAPRHAEPAREAEQPLAVDNDPEFQDTLRRLSHAPAGPTAAAGPGTDLPPSVHAALVAHLRTCWRLQVGQSPAEYAVRLHVVTDETGTVQDVKVAAEDMPKMTEPAFQGFAQAAIRAVLDPVCARFPIPAEFLNRKHAFDLVFKR